MSSLILKSCRTCTLVLTVENPKKISELITIFDTKIKLCDILFGCTSIQMSEEDLLPKYICNDCIDKALASYLFKEMCKQSEKAFLQRMFKHEPEVEINEAPDDTEEVGISNVTKCERNEDDPDAEHLNTYRADLPQFVEFAAVENSSNLKQESSTKISGLHKWKCQLCPKTYKHKTTYFRHVKQCHPYSLNNEQDFNRVSAKNNKYQCENCSDSFETELSQQEHKNKCSDTKLLLKYQCPHCPNYYFDKTLFDLHEKSKHSLTTIETNEIPTISSKKGKKRFRRPELILRGIKFPCQFCPKVYYSKNGYQKHKVASHKAEINQAGSHSKFLCPYCNNSYNLKKTCDAHIKIIHGAESERSLDKYQCEHCSNFYYNETSLEDHVNRVHSGLEESLKSEDETKSESDSGEKLYQCQFCPKSYKKSDSLRRHNLSSHASEYKALVTSRKEKKQQQLECQHCFTICLDKSDLKSHMENMHSEELKSEKYDSMQCQYCPKKYGIRNIRRHMMSVHTEEFNADLLRDEQKKNDRTKCLDCPDSFTTEEELRFHRIDKHGASPEAIKLDEERACNICNRMCSNYENLARHKIIVHKIYACEFCNFVGERNALLIHHRHREHAELKTWGCTECEKTFFYKSHLTSHTYGTHSATTTHICDVCGKNYKNGPNLAKHMRIHTGEKPYKCTVCDKSFNQRSTVRIHMRFHSDERNFPCDQCDRRFHIRGALLAHKRRHAGIKGNFKCTVCEKCFESNYLLNVHSTVHSGEKNFVCKVCGKAFSRSQTVKEHMKIHTGDKRFVCTVCDKRFIQKHVLRSHMNTHKVDS